MYAKYSFVEHILGISFYSDGSQREQMGHLCTILIFDLDELKVTTGIILQVKYNKGNRCTVLYTVWAWANTLAKNGQKWPKKFTNLAKKIQFYILIEYPQWPPVRGIFLQLIPQPQANSPVPLGKTNIVTFETVYYTCSSSFPQYHCHKKYFKFSSTFYNSASFSCLNHWSY